MRIGHYMSGMWDQGGVASYIRRLAAAQIRHNHTVFLFDRKASSARDLAGTTLTPRIVPTGHDLFAEANRLDLDILNLHQVVDALPDRLPVPTIRTLHNHAAYCPSGTQYLEAKKQPCHRVVSAGGCLWGHLAEYCGSLRPQNIIAGFRRTRNHQKQLARIPTITVSDFMKDQMVRAGYDPDRIFTVHSPAPPSTQNRSAPPKNTTPRFLFLGRLVPEKGVDWLLQALGNVQSTVHVDIAGDGYAKGDYEALSKELGVAGQVTFHGWLEPDSVNDLIRQARALVFPSVWHEPAGLVPLEGAANGRPTIAGRTGGIPEYVTNEYGLLVSPHDASGLAQALDQLAQNWSLADRLGRSGLKLAQSRFSMRSFIDRLHLVYRRAIRLHTRERPPNASL
jgi:glycosyltransferase involved in cell wall biosynthesis